jgi:nitrite reductase (NO-forming)
MSIRTEPPRTDERAPAPAPQGPPPPSHGREVGDAVWRSVPIILLALGILVLATVGMYAAGVFQSSAPAEKPAAAVDYRVMEGTGHVVTVNLSAEETVQQIAPDVNYHVWTFDGTAPGPVIRVKLGDTVRFTLTNNSSIGMQHSIDFHAAMTPWDKNYQPVDPGQTKTFDWVAMYPGVFMYHCGVPPVLQHISNGMYGAIVVEPNNLPKEREYVLVSSEFYPGAKPIDGVFEGDYDAMLAAKPTYVVFNGVADQYKEAPLVARPNEKFRIWVVNAGPTLTNAFHVIGTMFDTYPDGNPANVVYGDQTYNIPPGGSAMFELQIPDAGLYPFVTHAFAYTGLGSVGLVKIDPQAAAAPTSYPMMGDPFSAGVKPFTGPTGGTTTPSSAPPSGGATGSGTGATCAPKGTSLTVMAQTMKFDTGCLAAPAGKPFTIAFMNHDAGVPHNVSIYKDSTAAEVLFKGELVNGPASVTYKVDALPAGTYFFRCDVHPQMNGTLVVE